MKYILSLFLILVTIPSYAEIVSHNLVGSAENIRLTSNYQEELGTGEIQVQLCPTCRNRQLTITSDTNILKASKPVDLNRLKTYLHANSKAPMRLQFHNYTKQVLYIDLQPKNKEYPQ